MASPFDKIKVQSATIGMKPGELPVFAASNTGKSALQTIHQSSTIIPNLVIREEDVEKLGADLSRNVGATTEKIIQKMGVGKFDELGKILVDVQAQAHKLDPTSLQKSGVAGWLQRKFGDVKKELTLRLKNADAVFDDLSAKISNHITVHTEWIKDLEALNTENYQRYENIRKVIAQGEAWRDALKQQIDSWPIVESSDPDAGMKIQAKRDAESRLNRIQIKLDSFLRLKTITESNAVKIPSQQETSRTTVMTLKDVIEQTIPLIKMEFSLFIQSLDAQKSIQIVNSAKDLANTTLTKSADTAKQSAIDAATALNNPMIQTETLNHIRERMFETLDEVKKIEANATQVRQSDALLIAENQKKYLDRIQSTTKEIK